jgi:hypothetical protein
MRVLLWIKVSYIYFSPNLPNNTSHDIENQKESNTTVVSFVVDGKG